MNCTQEKLLAVLKEHSGGKVYAGDHKPGDGKLCILEAHSLCIGLAQTSGPSENNCWDLRQLNDLDVPIALRTKWMPKVMMAYANSRNWPVARQAKVAEAIATANIHKILANLPDLSLSVITQCREARTLDEIARVVTVIGTATNHWQLELVWIALVNMQGGQFKWAINVVTSSAVEAVSTLTSAVSKTTEVLTQAAVRKITGRVFLVTVRLLLRAAEAW